MPLAGDSDNRIAPALSRLIVELATYARRETTKPVGESIVGL